MRIFILFILIASIFTVNAFAQNTATTNIKVVNVNKIKQDVEKYVNDEITKWQTQGKYENTDSYKKRVTSSTRENKIFELTTKKTNEIANEVINLTIQSTEFDPDNEVYKISFIGLPSIYINVPISNHEASSFETNLENLIFKDAKYTLTNTGFALLELSVQNPKNWKTYQYHHLENLTFKQNKVQHSFEPVVIQTGEFKINTNETEEVVSLENEINIDNDLPKTKMYQPNSIAVIIGNKDYQKTSSVDYALIDANSIKNYLITSLGFKSGNILFMENISKADFEEVFGNQEFHEGRLFNMVKPNVSDVLIYYSGHGAPGIKNYKGYFIPVECDPNYLEFRGYSLETFYKNLAKLPAKSVTVVLDACFSGENVHKDISSILPKVKNPVFMLPNGVLLTSSTATQPSCWYNDQEHGLFTYFFLRAIKDKENSDTNKDGQLTFNEVYNYISSQTEGIPYYARRLHAKEQNPTIQGNKEKILIKY